jgi:ADP-heptose:LPS heptosyltransferase
MILKCLILLKNLWNNSLQRLRHFLLALIYLALKSQKKTNPYPKYVKKILLIRRNRLGDAINLIPIIQEIKKNYPNIEINVLANEYNAQIFEYCSAISSIFILNESKWLGQNFLFFNPIIRKLKEEKFDLAIAVGGYSSRLAKITYFLKSRYSVGIGSNKFLFDLVYDKAVIIDKDRFKSQMAEMAYLIKKAGLVIPKNLPYTNLGFLNRPKKNWLAICPDVNRKESQYPINLYGKIIETVLKDKKFKKISFFTAHPKSQYINLSKYGAEYIRTENLKAFISLLSKYQYVITAEGGSAHIAGALGLSVFIISGTKNQIYWKPHAKNIRTFINTISTEKIKPALIIKALYKNSLAHSINSKT